MTETENSFPIPVWLRRARAGAFLCMLAAAGLWAQPGPQTFATPEEAVKALVTATRMSREIGAGAALKDWRAREIAPGPDVRTDAEIAEYAMRTLLSYHHQVGTCKMGIDSMAVTTPDLRVHGADGLRVADASVMPAVTSGNTNAATIMIGERCADFLLR